MGPRNVEEIRRLSPPQRRQGQLRKQETSQDLKSEEHRCGEGPSGERGATQAWAQWRGGPSTPKQCTEVQCTLGFILRGPGAVASHKAALTSHNLLTSLAAGSATNPDFRWEAWALKLPQGQSASPWESVDQAQAGGQARAAICIHCLSTRRKTKTSVQRNRSSQLLDQTPASLRPACTL